MLLLLLLLLLLLEVSVSCQGQGRSREGPEVGQAAPGDDGEGELEGRLVDGRAA